MHIRKRLASCFCLLILVSFVFLVESVPAQHRSTISGHVFGPGRSPVGQVTVELRNDVNTVIGRARTDGSGRYLFSGVPSGRLSLTVVPLGTNFEQHSQELEIAGVGARGQLIPEHVQIDIHLKTRKASESTGGHGVVFVQEVPESAKRIYLASIADLDSQRTQPGISGLKQALEIFPTYFQALERLGAEQLKQQLYEEGAKSFSTATLVNERSFRSWQGLTYANFALKKWQPAVESAEKALELEKNSVNTLILLGISQRSLKRYEAAEKSLLRASKIDEGKTPDLYWNLALLYAYNLRKYQAAADALELYLKANPTIPDDRSVRKLIQQLRENRPPS